MRPIIVVITAIIAAVISGEYINYAAAEIQNPNYKEIYIPSIAIIIAGLAAVYFTNKNKGKYLVEAWWLLFIGLFLFVWHPNSSIDRLKCCTNSTSIFALYLLEQPAETLNFIDNYQENILEKQEFQLNDLPEYGFNTFGKPSSTKGSTPGSHPPGVVLVYYWGFKLTSLFSENVYKIFFGAPLLLLLMRSLLIISAYKIGLLLTKSRSKANIIVLIIISSPFVYLYSTGSTDISVAGLVATGFYFYLKYLLNNFTGYVNLFISGTFFALAMFITFGPFSLFALLALLLIIFRRKNTLLELLYFILPVLIMIFIYKIYGFDYLKAMPIAIDNIFVNYSSKKPYFSSIIGSIDRIFLVLGVTSSVVMLIGFWKIFKLLPISMLYIMLLISLGFVSIYVWTLFPSADLSKGMKLMNWSHYIPVIVIFASIWSRKKEKILKNYNKIDFLNMSVAVAGILVILFTVFSGKVRGEISRTSSFVYVPIIVSSACLMISGLKNINYSQLNLFFWSYLSTVIAVMKFF